MKHIRRFLESNNTDILEYFLDLEDKYDVNLRCNSIKPYYVCIDSIKNTCDPKEIIEDVWNCIKKVRSIGEFSIRHSDYAGLHFEFIENQGWWPPSSSWPSGTKMIFAGDIELSNFDNLISKIRNNSNKYLKRTIVPDSTRSWDPNPEILRGYLRYLDGDFKISIKEISIFYETH